MAYTVREELKPSGLNGISDEQINDHWNLYAGYVAQSNTLHQELKEMREAGKGATPAYADRRRRFGFEYCGMVLHEYYFGNLHSEMPISPDSAFAQAVTSQYGSLEAWEEDFVNTGKSRSIGWAVCYMDPQTGEINNHFIQLHEDGNIPGYHPLLVMDVFEHAYMVDHKAGGRPDYINAFINNINWDIVEERFTLANTKMVAPRF